MINAIILFDKPQEVSFLILPKIGETLACHSDNGLKYFKVTNIIHEVNKETNEGNEVIKINVSERDSLNLPIK